MMPGECTAAGLYIHIPFCITKCAYCDFLSVTDTGLLDAFIHALLREIDASCTEFREFDTVYIGGGTPSLLSLQQLETLLEKVHDVFTVRSGAEITIEINPADWGRKELSSVRCLGINRISIGLQSFDDAELSLMGRRHSSAQAIRTLEDAAEAGFDNLSVDLIYGLPGQQFPRWRTSLEQALTFKPSHLSCYELEIKHDTPLGCRYEKGDFPARSEDTQRDFFIGTSEFLEGEGYLHYEVSNFARTMDRASRHNQKYWDHIPYLGLGPSAHSYKDGRRWWNHTSLRDYFLDCTSGIRPTAGSENLSREQLRLEALFLGIRTKKGVDLEKLRDLYDWDLMAEKGQILEELQRSGLIEISGHSVCPTRAGMAVADSLVLL